METIVDLGNLVPSTEYEHKMKAAWEKATPDERNKRLNEWYEVAHTFSFLEGTCTAFTCPSHGRPSGAKVLFLEPEFGSFRIEMEGVCCIEGKRAWKAFAKTVFDDVQRKKGNHN